MELKKNELKVYYNLKERINRKLDDAIIKAVKETTDLKFSGSGVDLTTGDRDIIFNKK